MDPTARHNMPSTDGAARWSPRLGMVSLAIVLVAVVGYGHTLEAPFVFDDIRNIQNNASLHVTSFDWEQLSAAAQDGRDNARPVAYLSFALTHFVFGGDIAGYHLANIAIHILNGLLVFGLVLATLRLVQAGRDEPSRGDTACRWAALIAALLFVAHPTQTQAVTYTVQRMTSLAAMFYLAALLLFVRGRLANRRTTCGMLWLSALVSWSLALGTKQIAATLPAVVFLYEWYFFRDLSMAWLRRTLRWFAVPITLGFVGAGLIFVDGDPLGRLQRGYAIRDFTMAERLLTQPRVIVEYLSLMFYPAPSRLNLLHAVETSRTMFDPATTGAAWLFIGSLVLFAVAMARRARVLSFCIVWFFIHLAIESTIFPLEMMYEHRLYLPMFGLTLLTGYVIMRLIEFAKETSWASPLAGVVSVLLLATLTYATWSRNTVWNDPILLWTDVLEKTTGDHPAAVNERTRAYNNRGRVYGGRGQHVEAVEDFTQALTLDSGDALCRFNRGLSYRASGAFTRAAEDFTVAIQLQDEAGEPFAAAYLQRGQLHREQGDYANALRDLERAVEQSPRLGEAYLSIAWIRATCPEAPFRDSELALSIARAGCEATGWRDPIWIDALACAYAASGQFEAALHWETTAISMTHAARQGEMKERQRCFKEGRAFLEPTPAKSSRG